MTYAAIDIGSNAVRLLFSNVYDGNPPIYRKSSLIRVPIRLGEDAFENHFIPPEKADILIKAISAFKILMDIHAPDSFMACATSAIREATNGGEIVDRIIKETGIPVEVIDGRREAEIIYSNHIAENLSDSSSYLYIEVGGGSTELTIFSGGEMIVSRTFAVGTVRMLKNKVARSEWNDLKEWVRFRTNGLDALTGIGSGGNINFLFKMLRRKEGKPLGVKKVKNMYQFLKSHTIDERITHLGLRPDRADVIIPALEIYLSVMKWAGITKIIVPNIGLADGIIHLLHERYLRSRDAERSSA